MTAIVVPNSRTLAIANILNPTKNPNHMPEDRFRLLVKAIAERGFLQPILCHPDPNSSNYRIIDGYHRTRAAKELGMTELPAVVVESEAAGASLLQIGMNRLRGELNLTEVADQLAELARTGMTTVDLTVTGFSSEEITALLAAAAPAEDDLLGQDFTMDPDDVEPEKVERPFTIELTYKDAATLKKVKRGLRKAAGKGGDIADGLLRLLEGT